MAFYLSLFLVPLVICLWIIGSEFYTPFNQDWLKPQSKILIGSFSTGISLLMLFDIIASDGGYPLLALLAFTLGFAATAYGIVGLLKSSA